MVRSRAIWPWRATSPVGRVRPKFYPLLPTHSAAAAAAVDTWVDYAQSLALLSPEQRLTAIALTLEHALQSQTYLVGHTLTLADLAVFGAAGFPTQATDLADCLRCGVPAKAVAARRWICMMARHPALQEATQLCVGVNSSNSDNSNARKPSLTRAMCWNRSRRA